MSIELLIGATPFNPTDLETYDDRRMRLHLLYREGNARIDALATPFGEQLTGTKDVAHFMQFLPDGSCKSHTIHEGRIHQHAAGSKHYFTLESDRKKTILPYLFSEPAPSVIVQNGFRKKLEQCSNELGSIVVTEAEEMIDLIDRGREDNSGIRSYLKELSDCINTISEAHRSMYASMRSMVFDAMEDQTVSSTNLPYTQRQLKHIFFPSVLSKVPKKTSFEKEIFMRYAKVPRDIARHAIYTEAENAQFDLPRHPKDIEVFYHGLQFIQQKSQRVADFMKLAMIKKEHSAARSFRNAGVVTAGATLIAGLPVISAGILGYTLLDAYVSKKNKEATGHSTGVIGTVRGALFEQKRYQNPLHMRPFQSFDFLE